MTHSHEHPRHPRPRSLEQPVDPWEIDPSSASVDCPSAIIATIPGTLGYYPQESVILMGLVADGPTGDCVYIGPVLRTDLCRASELSDALLHIPVDRCIAFFAVVVSRIPRSRAFFNALDEMEALVRADGAPVVEICWHVSEIAQGTPYSMVFGPGPDDFAALGWDEEWERGVIGSVIHSPAMRSMRENGALPALSRDDTFAYFEPDTDPEKAKEATALTIRAHKRADAVRRALDAGNPAAGTVVKQALAALRSAPALPLIGDDSRLSADDVVRDSDELYALVTVLTRAAFRDCLIGEALRHPEEAGAALLAVARSYSGIVRANALSVWALVAISRGLSSWASAALATAQDEMPLHSMSAICLQVMAIGQQHQLVTTAVEGCEMACADLLREE